MAISIALKHLSVVIDGKTIISDLSLEIPARSFFSILGRSGVGKTTILRSIAGLIIPHEGSIRSSGEKSIPTQLAYMAQEDLLLPWLTVENNVILGARLRGAAPDRDRARRLIEAVGLIDNFNARPTKLSGGMRQRVALARTLYEDQPIVLMDEPFSALDYVTRLSVQSTAAELLRGRTTVLVTHDVSEACRLSSHIYVLNPALPPSERMIGLTGTSPRDPGAHEVVEVEKRVLEMILVGSDD